ncbi:hypothetical protein ACFQI3_12765 [Hansschlegelia quercus]|uniref:Uncharacterized protein n=1 Tax=Hansschlegelia quercus TaxID=2528245 RepID=A0A4Q9GNZ4_9HYPH|nr:hypothetical protein [Hansschlegelia quercus]TBN53287.1 hypothetical protein EYR15_09680 [Hansschlegelia quercus]
MVEPILYSAFGFLLATLLWLLFLPAFWRRAVRLTRARMIDSLPVSADVIVASQDRLRAEHAVAMRAAERRAELAVGGLDTARLAAARARAAELGQRADIEDLRAKVAALEAEDARMRRAVGTAMEGEKRSAEVVLAAETARDQLVAELKASKAQAETSRLAAEQARIEAATLKSQIAKLEARGVPTTADNDGPPNPMASLFKRAPERAGA